MGGLYTIHTFVFPSDLDLSVVVPGVTTGGDVLELLAANDICASLDVAGAAFNVTAPMAGTLSGGGDVCLSGDAVTLTATPDGNSNTPDGYSLAYVLTSGTELTIQQLGGAPEFDVTMGGLYTIHTFVFPSDLDLSVVVPGVTTGGDVLGPACRERYLRKPGCGRCSLQRNGPDGRHLERWWRCVLERRCSDTHGNTRRQQQHPRWLQLRLRIDERHGVDHPAVGWRT